jgi:calcium-dependent protein kinase
MFYRMDFSGDGALDLHETKKLIKFLLKEEKRLLNPPKPGMTITHLPRKNLKQEFELGKKLGQGGQGAVYLGKELASGTMRVVKFYEKSGGNSCLEDITDEFELLKRLDHPNMARICEVFEDMSNIYVISEPYSGGDLVTVTQKAQENGVQLTHQWLGLIFLQVVEGIRYLHSKETMHCDLKEPNVMIADDKHWDAPQVVVIDFGMAKNFAGTRAGGTPGYMPPEFWQYQLWTPKGDMFALAVTFWGIYNFRQGGPFQVPDAPPFQRIQQATCAQPMDCSRFPPGLKEVVQQMATKDFRQRPSAKQVLESAYFRGLASMEDKEPLDNSMIQGLVKASQRSAAQNMMALELSSQKNLGQMKQLNALFRQLDGDGDGTVKADEATEVLAKMGLPADACQKLMDALVGDDGKIKYSEFMAKMIASQESMSAASLSEAFNSIDKDHSGSLNRAEIAELMTHKNMASIVEGRSADDLLQEMDQNGDGEISFDEFKRTMLGETARPKANFSEGDDTEYYSASYGKWIPCKITAVDPHGRVQISVKPGAWLDAAMQSSSLRKPGGGKGGGKGGYA